MAVGGGYNKEVKVAAGCDPTTVLELVDSLYKKGSAARSQFLVKADRNERYFNGEQFQDINRLTGVLQDVPWQNFVPKVTHNLLRNLCLTWTSRLLRNRPSVSAYPHNAEVADIHSSQAAATIIEFFERENDIDEMMFDVLLRACFHGVGGVKLIFDPEEDQVTMDPITIFDFVMDPKEKVANAGWVVFEKFLEEDEANSLLRDANIKEKATTVEYYVGTNEYRQGVKVRELWYRPDYRIESGLYALVVSGHVVSAMDYPYIFSKLEEGEGSKESILPLALFVIDPRRGTCWGDTWMNDAVPIQRQINEVESTLTKLRRDTAGCKLVAPGVVADALDTNNQIIKLDDPQQAQIIRYMEPPRINSLLFADRDFLPKLLYDLAGLNELMVGAESAKSGQSAKTIAYLSELDAMKQAGTSRSIERFLLETWRKTLLLVRNFYTEPRLLTIIGEDNAIGHTSFIGTDIDGVGLRLEPRTGKARYTDYKRAEIVEQGQMGIRDQEEVRSAVETGVASPAEDQRQNGAMAQVVKAVLSGAEPYVDETVDPVFATEYLTNVLEVQRSLSAPERIILLLEQLVLVYRTLEQQANQPMMAPSPDAMGAQQAPAGPDQIPNPQGPPYPGGGLIQ